MTNAEEIAIAARRLGAMSYVRRLEKFGLPYIQEVALANLQLAQRANRVNARKRRAASRNAGASASR